MKKNINRGLSLCLILSSILLAELAKADSPSFSYVELEYIVSGEIDVRDGNISASVDTDGYAINASVELGIFLLQASRFELESDELLGSSLEDSISTIAVGLTFELPKTAIYGLVRARRDELSLSGGVFDEDEEADSVGVEAGVRVNLTDRFELNANFGSPALDSGTSYGVGAQLYITKNLGITLDYNSIEVEEDDIEASFDTTSVGLRYNF